MLRGPIFFALSVLAASIATGQPSSKPFRAEIPKVWDERALRDWATPLAGLNARPSHLSAKEYYALRPDDLRTYPVYAPGREPAGYWDMLQNVGPKPLIDPSALAAEADWVAAGRRVFEELDFIHMRTLDPKYIHEVRNPGPAPSRVLSDGTLFGMRWVPTKDGVALTFSNCSFCHTMFLPDGKAVHGAPFRTIAPRPPETFKVWPVISRVQQEKGVLVGAPPFYMPTDPIGERLYRAYGVPWAKDDPHEKLRSAGQSEYESLDLAARAGGIPRWNGSILFPAKAPDLIGIKDRKYIDHTATHLHRDAGDLMRYAALVTSAEAAEFGPHRMLGEETRRSASRVSDEALYALALYLYSLAPPENPNPFDDKAASGQKIFARQCAGCHTPPLYTNNKLTLAEGFQPLKGAPRALDVLPISVGTDSSLALRTRKGTGYYKVPSLKGVWYRGRYLHDGSVATLEEMFDPERLKESHLPGGFRPLGSQTRAILGHTFGLDLSANDRECLVAFLKTL
ncbi:MAG: hypothetical protein SFV18_17660 [Bryobacteraceae bacterium]|nr:hypothetical protein [Bryobacteraceae bacterium]